MEQPVFRFGQGMNVNNDSGYILNPRSHSAVVARIFRVPVPGAWLSLRAPADCVQLLLDEPVQPNLS